MSTLTFDEFFTSSDFNPKLNITSTIHITDNSVSLNVIDKMIHSAHNELLEYLKFDYSWDGYNGMPFDKNLIKMAVELLEVIKTFFYDEISLPEEITPGPASDGSIDIELAINNKILIFTLYCDIKEIQISMETENGITEDIIEFEIKALENKLNWLVD